jgi:hypothetical protein
METLMNIKPNRILIGAFSFLAALAVSQPVATAQPVTVTLKLISPPGSFGNGANAGGIYLSPYYFSINGGSSVTPLICDDFSDEITQGESWTATVTTGQVPSANYGALSTGGTPTQTEYEEIGYLASLLLTPPTPTTGAASTTGGPDQTALSYALWSILDPALDVPATLSSYLGSSVGANGILETTNVNSALANANAAAVLAIAGTGTNYLNGLTIYQPVLGTQNIGGTAVAGAPQQFVTYNAPEALSPTFLAFDLLALFVAVFLVRRRGISNATGSR